MFYILEKNIYITRLIWQERFGTVCDHGCETLGYPLS